MSSLSAQHNALFAFAAARKALLALFPPGPQPIKLAITHDGEALFFRFAPDASGAWSVGIASETLFDAGAQAPDAPAPTTEAPKAKGRPKKEAPTPEPSAASAVQTDKPAAVMTKDEFRAFATQATTKLGGIPKGIDAVKAILGMPIDQLDPATYPALKAKLEAAIAAASAPSVAGEL